MFQWGIEVTLDISSLINLKDFSLGDQIDLSDVAGQIDAIRIVHEKLIHSDDIAHIGLREYVQELLSTVFSFCSKQVKIEENIEDISIRTKTAIPIGLIVNEIATNAVKHSFPSEDEATFSIELFEDESVNQYTLRISITGKPFPKDIDLDNPHTLGLRLITALVEQLQGTIDLQREPHPVFTIRFPIKN
jgi:two-component sensor histidine kinase